MKNFLVLCCLSFHVQTAIAQQKRIILKSDVLIDKPFKAPQGTVYINPLKDFTPGYVKKIKDTLSVSVPYSSRFYPNIDSLPGFEDQKSVLEFLTWRQIPSSLNMAKALRPFYIHDHEVSNAEYRLFLQSLDRDEKIKNYPDTTRWVKDFTASFNDPMQQYYFGHPKYDHYPVVGVTYFQAKAFCKWLEERLNQNYNLNGSKIEVDLPNQVEWAFANGDTYEGIFYQNQFFDKDYQTNLQVQWDSGFYNLVNRSCLPGYANINQNNWIEDGYMYTAPFYSKKTMKVNNTVGRDEVNGVYFLNSNVSEWCSETYQDNWKQLYEWRQTQLRSIGTKEALMTADLERYYNSFNDTISGQMVRGGSWLFEHHAERNGQNVGMHNAKLFINPNESHSTVGFRYVIRIKQLPEN